MEWAGFTDDPGGFLLSIEHARDSVVATPAPTEAAGGSAAMADDGAGETSHPMLAFLRLDPSALVWPSSTDSEGVR